jgi:2-polyprenyl-6-methoxyphenol hydroxylase-like FAD-dependent oxidoreductase
VAGLVDGGRPVLVVGAGPAGLFAGCELSRHGVPVRIVERRATPHREARATAIQPAGLELLARSGLDVAFLSAGVRVRRTRFIGPGMAEIATSSFGGIGCPHEYQCSLPQWRSEQLLADRLEALGGRVERGVEVRSVEESGDGLLVTLRQADGTTETAWFRVVLGAGGAHSVTRHAMLLRLAGDTYAGRYIVADVRAGLPAAPEEGMLLVGATGFVLLSPLPEGRWILFVNGDEGDASPDPPPPEQLAALVSRRIGVDAGLHDVAWSARFLMHRRIVPRLADGCRFLLGDEAHLTSPIGGEGLNAALMDAADIAWKLALVLRGRARASLLDTYAIERGLADRHALDVSDTLHRRVMGLVEACAAGAVPSAPPAEAAQLVAAARARAMLDVSYAGSPLAGASAGDRFPDRTRLRGPTHHLLMFGAPCPEALRRRWAGLVEVVHAAAAGFEAERAGVPQGGAALVRPDGFVGFRAAPADGPGLAALEDHLGRYLIPAGLVG